MSSAGTLDEVIISPIDDAASGERLGALVLGFPAENLSATAEADSDARSRVGVWLDGGVHGLNLPATAAATLPRELAESRRRGGGSDHFPVWLDGAPYLVFHQPLEVGASFPPADGVCLYSLVESRREETPVALADHRLGRGGAAGGFRA